MDEAVGDRQPLSGVVLSGGRSRRLGQDKALLRLWGAAGPTLLEATVAHLAAACDEVLVVTDRPRDWPALPARVAYDRWPGGGALGGIYTGLEEARYPFILAVACDMPFLSRDLLRSMAARRRDYDVLIPRWGRSATDPAGQVEPLHAIYGRPCLEPMRARLEQGERRIVSFFSAVHVCYLDEDELARFDPYRRAFRNINTPEDLAGVRDLLGQADL
jgi:molybdopterin-guanine dinucleotide biosynthesis protein A